MNRLRGMAAIQPSHGWGQEHTDGKLNADEEDDEADEELLGDEEGACQQKT